MTETQEKPEHHLTRAKRLREEALVSSEVKVEWRPYRVFNDRSALVAQVNSIEEAEEELARFPWGSFQMI